MVVLCVVCCVLCVVCCVLCVVFGWCCGKSVERVVTGGGKGWMLFYRYKKTRRSGFF